LTIAAAAPTVFDIETITLTQSVERTTIMVVERDSQEVVAVLSAGKALAIVEVLLQAPGPLSAREIGERSGVNRTTAHRLLNTLMLHGWVERHREGGYRLSVKFLALAHVSAQVRGLFDEIRPALQPLSELSRETVHVGVLDGFDIVHVDKIESLEHVGVSSRIGARGVTHRTGLGKALLAASTDDFIAAYIEQARHREPPHRIRAAESGPLWDEVRVTRERGYSLDDEDDSVGVRCLGAAVRGAGGNPIFAVSLTGPSPRFTREICERLAPTLLAVTNDLSTRFGGEPDARVRASHDAA
jgi:DNA-binding IclR family transcriptional regulator